MIQTGSNEIKGDVLIVDDDLPSLRLLSDLLAGHGYQVRSARDGSTALMMISAESPDIILLDILMPGMDGFQLCEELKSNSTTRAIPVLFISARDEVIYKIKGFEVGGVDYINKPYQIDEVLARIDTHLTLSRLQSALIERLNELSALHKIAGTLTTTRELSQALEVICKTITELFGAQLALIALKEEDSGELKGLYGYERTCGAISYATELALPGDMMPYLLENGTGRPTIFTNIQNMPFSEQIQGYIKENHLQSGLIMPLSYQGVNQGILIVTKDESDITFTRSEIDLAETIAKDISTAIENENLNKKAQLAAVGAERQRMARDLHDSVSQLIYSLTLLCSGWETMARQGTLDNPADSFRQLGAVGQQALREMRLLIDNLRPSILDEEGLVMALQQRLDSVERRANIDAQLTVQGSLEDLPKKMEYELFNIAQEALNNSLRHSNAESIKVQIEENQGKMVLIVEDDGKGFNPSARHTGMGLQNMQERAQSIGGELFINSEVGHGTRVTTLVVIRKVQQQK